MKKNIKKLVLIALIFSAFLLWIPNAKAAGEHEFSFRAYKCGEIDFEADPETEEICMGPEGDYETPEYDYDNLVVNPGDIIKLAVHYKPGTDTFWMISAFFFYNPDLVGAVYDQDNLLLYKQTGTEFTPGNVGPYPPSGTSTSAKKKTRWTVGINDAKQANEIASVMEDESTTLDTRKYLEQEGNLYYIYFQVKDDATPGATIDFTYDMNQGKTKIANNAPVTNQDISFTVYEEQSDDNTLATLTVKNGSTNYTLTPEFVPGSKVNKTFTTYVPNNITSVDIAATPNEEHGIVSGTGTKSNLQVGNNSYQINVLSQSGLTEIYTVNVYRLSNDATLSALTLSNVDIGTFNKNTTSYTATVPYTTDKTNVTATATASNKATITGTGNNKPLNVGENTISVTVSPENCKSEYSSVPGNTCTTKTYTVTVTREAASTVSTLNDLLVDGTRVTGFTPGDPSKTYTLADVGYTKSNIAITYVKGEDHESVTGDGTKTLSVGQNTFDVVVTAQDGTTKTTYTIKVYKKSNNANLSALNVTSSKAGTLTPNFGANTTNYTYSVDADETSVNVSYTLAHEHASATTTPANLTGINPRTTSSVTIEVTPEDTTQTKKTYTITFDVAKSTNGNLSGITIDTEPLSGFQSDDYSYDITVPSTTESINVGATLEDSRANITGGTGVQTLDYGSNTIEITVQPEDPNAEPVTYTLNVIREKEDVSTLNDLLVDGARVTGFTPGDPSKTYTLTDVGYDKSQIVISYVKGESHETITGDGTKTLSVGQNTFDVVVTAHNGVDKTTYTIKVYRKSNDATLKSLSVSSDPAGTLDPAFNKNTTSYTYSVDADEDEVSISAAATHDNATIAYTGLTEGKVNPRITSSVTITVTPEDTTQAKKTYTITFDVAKSTNGDLSSITVDGDEIDGFNPNDKEYELTVPSTTESINIGATLEDDRANITGGTGVQPLDYGENTIEITVQPEDPNAEPVTYTLTVTREKEDVSTLNDLTVDGTRVNGFTPGDGTKTYTLDAVGYSKSSIVIGYTKGESHETVTGDGEKTLQVGDNSFDVVVTAHNGTDKTTYTIKIYRQSNDATLKELNVTSSKTGRLDPAFGPNTTTYTYYTDADETSVNIEGVKNHDGASVSGNVNGVNPRNVSSVTITVTPEDTTQPSKSYTITFDVAQSSNSNLSNITINGDTIQGFDSNDTDYEITVPSNTSQVDIEAELEDGRGTISGDTGMQSLDYGTNTFVVTGNAEDGTPKDYTITITREKKHDDTLLDIKVDNVSVEGFSQTDPDGTEYSVNDVSNSQETVNITVVTNDEDAVVSGTGDVAVSVGDNKLPVTITAHDGTTSRTYYINVRRKDSDASLKTLTITSDPAGTWDQPFDPSITEYTYTVDRDEDEIEVSAEANGEKADVSGTGTYNPQDDDTIQIMVTPEDGQVEIYTIHIVKAKSDDADLASLEVEGYTIDPNFDPDETEYSVTVPSNVDKVNIIATTSDRLATISGDGEQDVDYGANHLPVVVTPEDPNAQPKTYTIIVTRELSASVKLSDLTVDGTTVPGFDPDRPAYDLGTVPNSTKQITIGATASGPVTSIEGTGTKDVEVGKQTFEVVITAQDGQATGTYTITIEREASDDNTLKSLEVEGYTLDPEFDPDEENYSITVPSDVNSVTVNAEPNEEGATVTIEGNDNLQPGDNTITVKVEAPNGEEKTYTITVTKEEDDEKITSSKLTIADGMIKDVPYRHLPLDLKNDCDNDNEKLFIFANDEDTDELASDHRIGTGMVIKLIKNGRLNDKDDLVVKGELTGDGDIGINDVVRAVNIFVGEQVTGVWFEAADAVTDGEILINDVVQIVNLYVSE